jgi:predicted RNA-binding Zn-ribbon protein involved in translation (DUF1610 family)
MGEEVSQDKAKVHRVTVEVNFECPSCRKGLYGELYGEVSEQTPDEFDDVWYLKGLKFVCPHCRRPFEFCVIRSYYDSDDHSKDKRKFLDNAGFSFEPIKEEEYSGWGMRDDAR